MPKTSPIQPTFFVWLLNYSPKKEEPTPLKEAFRLLGKEFKQLSEKPMNERKQLSPKIKLLAQEEKERLENSKYRSIRTFFNKLSQLFKGHGFIPLYKWAEKKADRLVAPLPPINFNAYNWYNKAFQRYNDFIHSEDFNLESIPWKEIGKKFEYKGDAIPKPGDPNHDWHFFCIQFRLKYLINQNKSFFNEEISKMLSTGAIHVDEFTPTIMTPVEIAYINKNCDFTLT